MVCGELNNMFVCYSQISFYFNIGLGNAPWCSCTNASMCCHGDSDMLLVTVTGWTRREGSASWYLFNDTFATYDEAVALCAAEGAQLASVTSLQEQEFFILELSG